MNFGSESIPESPYNAFWYHENRETRLNLKKSGVFVKIETDGKKA
jgi:hypothetical protein